MAAEVEKILPTYLGLEGGSRCVEDSLFVRRTLRFVLLERDYRFRRAVLVRRCSFSFDSSIAVISIEACDVAA